MDKKIYLVADVDRLAFNGPVAGTVLAEIKPLAPYSAEDVDIAMQLKTTKGIVIAPDEKIETVVKKMYPPAKK